ncbi:hypothetical protein ACX1DX_09095 [Tessaracoccus sp. Y36]
MWKSAVGGVGAFLTVKTVFIAALAAVVGAFPLAQLTAGDAGWYLRIAGEGYPEAVPGGFAFFPLLPGLTNIALALGVPGELALLAAAWLGSVVAVIGIQRVGHELGSGAVGFWLAFCWAVAPRSELQAMGFAEGWVAAFVAWGIWAMLTRRSFLAGIMGLLAGLTHVSGLPYLATLWLWWLAGVGGSRRERGWRSKVRLDRLGAALLGSLGLGLYWLYVGYRMGAASGFPEMFAGRNGGLGSPLDGLVRVWGVLTGQADGVTWGGAGTDAVAVAVAVVLVLVLIYMREHWLVIVPAALAVVLALMQGRVEGMGALLLPWFALWLPLARLFARVSPWVMVPVALALTVGSAMWGIDGAMYRWSP